MNYKELIILIAKDLTDREMAEKLGYSPYYVRDCISKLIHKYGCRTRTGILLKAVKNKDISLN